jgi:hypothetical protein
LDAAIGFAATVLGAHRFGGAQSRSEPFVQFGNGLLRASTAGRAEKACSSIVAGWRRGDHRVSIGHTSGYGIREGGSMLYSILIYGTDADIANLSKAEEERLIGQHIVVQGKLAAERKLGPVVRLHPSTTAMTLRKGPEAYIIDGPFAETKEQLLGFYVVDCATQEEALEAARMIGGACTSRALEVRPISWFQLTDSIDHTKATVRVEAKP